MRINLEEFKKREEYIGCQKHPTLPLTIWNYNHKAMFDHAWDEFVNLARGLITDSAGNILYRPFYKFFNLGEREETQIENLAKLGEPKIYEKLDGSLGIQYYDGDIPQIATRGSFTSDQAKWASRWIETRYLRGQFKEGYTYIYEIVYPENRIVVDYKDREECVLLAVINTETGRELDYIAEAKRLDLSYAQPIKSSVALLQDAVKTLSASEEGYVLLYPNGLRVKLKGEEYRRLHKLIYNLSTISIWEALQKDYPFFDTKSIGKDLPSEFMSWALDRAIDIADTFNVLRELVLEAEKESRRFRSRKTKAQFLLKNYADVAHIVFAAMDNKASAPLIWKMVRPKYATPFKQPREELE